MTVLEHIGVAALRLGLALVLGGLIGWQRESAEKPAGFRTHILVCVGAALFTLISAVGFFGTGADPARVASNIVVGIGFLGAGTIWRTGASVQGLTTAASLWTVAAIGTAVGVGYYIGAILTTAIVAAVLTLFKGFEARIPRRGVGHLSLVIADRPGQIGRVGTLLGSLGVNIEHVDMSGRQDEKVVLTLGVRLPPRLSRDEVLVALGDVDGVEAVRWEDTAA
ncbi:MAG: MgtC/SapB family protein [Armatimonadota bacterium]|nr:MgtC/SapB family protein [Armatimonadota bacterium]MDR7437028.1 MgtC/SapB family protein [Armatimonadota bacterium]MDR7472901.1 MgtC/SapB family protein [Armatimonadota bacterium]MDR7507695.1 MgtC/SapB family protein [Armatimonadota bacterium]MDR7508914.1 MgtC/SapB family protein [Armatimonadota bacterium]